MEKDRILLISTSPFYKEKGSTLRIYAIVKMLAEAGYKIDLIAYSMGKDVSITNVTIHRTPAIFKPNIGANSITISKGILTFFVFLKTWSLLRKNKYEIVHCEDFEAAVIGRLLARQSQKLVYGLHNRPIDNLSLKNIDAPNFVIDLIWKIERFVVKKCDLIILNWKKYEDSPVFKGKKTIHYYDRVDITLLEEYPIPEGEYLVYSGNFEAYQGLEEFLNVYKKCNASYKLVLVGNPSELIKDLVVKKGLQDKVILTGLLSIAQSNYVIKNAVGAILPRIDGSSMKAIHYLMLGKPVIAKFTPSNAELLTDWHNAFLYSNYNQLMTILKKVSTKNFFRSLDAGVEQSMATIKLNWESEFFINQYRNALHKTEEVVIEPEPIYLEGEPEPIPVKSIY